jgi:hypothetical protein
VLKQPPVSDYVRKYGAEVDECSFLIHREIGKRLAFHYLIDDLGARFNE